jgi:hypothetical protein
VTVKNGTIRGLGYRGVELSGRNALVEGVRARSNGSVGIAIQAEGCRVSNCIVTDNGSAGIIASETCIVNGNVSRLNAGDGIHAENGSIVTGNTTVGNGGNGVNISDAALVLGNVIVENGSSGMEGGYGTVSDNVVSGNDANGIGWSEGVVSNNAVLDNGSEGVIGANLVTGNAVTSNTHAGVSLGPADGYSNNVVNGNNGGNGNPQVDNGIEIGGNVCGADITCP